MRAQARPRHVAIADPLPVRPGLARLATRCQLAICVGGMLAASLTLSACGQRGPLYLPADKQPPANSLTIQPAVEQTAPPLTSDQPSQDDKPASSDTPTKTGNN